MSDEFESSMPTTTDELLDHARWVHDLARSLVSDPDLAADLAQATCVVAIERPPVENRNPRGWLAKVLQNLLRQHRRREGMRRERESRAARPEALPSVAEMAAEVQSQRMVVDAVLELSEPYRSVVLWRFFRGLKPRQIARREGIPVHTVDSQLQRGLKKLQSRLDRTHGGDRRAWLTALAPLTKSRVAPIEAVAGAMMMKTKTLAAITLLAIASLTWWILDPGAPNLETGRAVERAAANETADPEAGADPASSGESRESLRPAPASARMASRTQRTIHGLVYDASGRPLADIEVEWLEASAEKRSATTDAARSRARSDRQGRFELLVGESDQAQRIQLRDTEWTTVMAGLVAPNSGEDGVKPVVVAARSMAIHGKVIDDRGNPLDAATVTSRLPDEFATRFPVSLDATVRVAARWSTRTDEAGAFSLFGLGRIPGARLIGRRANFLPTVVPQPATSETDLTLTLSRPAEDATVILGQVIDEFGDPVADVDICFGKGHALSDSRGMFSLPRSTSLGRKILHAMKRGYLPTRTEVPDASSSEPSPTFLYITIDGEPLSIRGRVVDRSGSGVSGVRVWAEGGEMVPFLSSGSLATVEGFLSGARTPKEWRAEHPGKSFSGVIDREPLSYWGWVETNRDGYFELGGLQEKDYELGLFRVAGLQLARSEMIRAGGWGVEIRFTPEVHEKVAGRVVGPSGEPVPDVLVQLCCRASRVDLRDEKGAIQFTNGAVYHGPEVRTGKDGRFEFADVGVDQTLLTLNGDMIQSQVFGLEEGGISRATSDPIHELRIRVKCRMHIRIELASPNEADSFQVIDRDGELMSIVVFEGGGRNESRRRDITDGRTRVYAVGQDAQTVVLHRGKGESTEVRRVPLRLMAGHVFVVQ